LQVSQPSISQQLRLLEVQYGRKLYRRCGKGVEITEAGQLFLRDITPIMEQVARLENGFKTREEKARREVLRVAGAFCASAILLPTLLARFQQRHPGIELESCTATSNKLEQSVLDSVSDLAVSLRAAHSPDLICEPLARERVALFVRADHRLAKKKNLKLADVLTEPLIIRGGQGGSRVTDRALQQIHDSGLEVKIGMRCDGPAAIKAAVRQRMGVGMVFADSVKAEVAAGDFKILNVRGLKLEGHSYIIYSKKRPLSPLAQEFLELLREKRTSQVVGSRSKRSSRSIAALSKF
jgi:DNA-binding transcriptional LysR family regulator